MFGDRALGVLVPVRGKHPTHGRWEHVAFVPDPLPAESPLLSPRTFGAVADARAALASLDSSARQLPNPQLLRRPALRREAQSTSALEGTYAPLESVLAADTDEVPADADLAEVLNYVHAAEAGFSWVEDGKPLTVGLMEGLHARLVRGTSADTDQAGRLRNIQVVIGGSRTIRVQDARFVPRPPGADLEAQVHDLFRWMQTRLTEDGLPVIDPVVAAAMAHYQFEALHPFNDGNGRLGRLLVVLHLIQLGTLREPTLTVSPWFESRRAEYYDHLLRVSSAGDWDGWTSFFARGLAASARSTERQLVDLLAVQRELKEWVRAAGMRAASATEVVDFATAQPIFTVRQVQRHVGLTYARANGLVRDLVAIDVLRQYDEATYDRRFTAPRILEVVLRP
jgi:Fic family protein